MGVFTKLNTENKKKQYEKSGGNFDSDINFYNFKEGKNRIRILPPTKDYPDYEFKVFKHYNIGLDNKESVVCPKRTFGSRFKCAICEENAKLYKSKDKDDKELAKQLYASERNLANIIDLDEDAEPKNVYVMSYGYTIANDIVKKISDPDYGDITDIENGFNLNIEKEINKGGQPRYVVEVKKQCPCPEFDETTITKLNQIYKTVLTYEGLQMVLNGESVELAVESYGLIDVATGEIISSKTKKKAPVEDEDEAPKTKKKAPVEDEDETPKSKKKAPVEDEDEMPDDTDEDEAPKTKKKVPVEDEDDNIMNKNFKKPQAKKEEVESKTDDNDDDDVMAMLKARKAKMQK